MSYQFSDIRIPMVDRIATNANPGIYDLGGLSGTDAVTLIVSAVVSGYVGAGPAVFSLQQSWDDGVTWVTLPNTVNITGAGTFVWKHDTASNGQLSPKVRAVITPPGADQLALSKLKKTFSPSNTITPSAVPAGSGGGASEATLLVVNANVQAVNTSVQATTTALNTQVDTKTSVLNTSIQATTTAITSLDKGAGVTSATTLRNVPASDAPHLLAPRHEAVGTPLAFRLSDATDFLTSLAVAAAQLTFATVTKALHVVSTMTGWDGATHREIAVDTAGNVKTIQSSGLERVVANPPLKRDYGTSPLLANTWTQIIAATTLKATLMDVFDSSGEPIEISFDAGATVAFQFSPGGNSQVPYAIPQGSTVHIRSVNAVNTVGTYFLLNLLT
jgi:hypothetical protein